MLDNGKMKCHPDVQGLKTALSLGNSPIIKIYIYSLYRFCTIKIKSNRLEVFIEG